MARVEVEIPLNPVAGEVEPGTGEPQQTEQTPQSGKLLAGKFKNVEEMERSYTELEKKLGSRSPAATETPETPVTPPAKLGDTISTPVVEPSAPAELDLTPYQAEWDKNGKLSDASYAKLAKDNKIGKTQVDEFIAFRVAKVEQFRNEVYESVGGQEQFTQMLDWAKTNLSQPEQVAYDKAMVSNDPGVIKLAVEAVNAKFTRDNGQNPKLIGGRAGSAGTTPYRSVAELMVAMNDPKYQLDEAYRADVEKRLAVSDII